MPRPITALDVKPAVASYQLGKREAWTLNTLTALLDPGANGGPVIPILYVTSPTGDVIYAQPFAYLEFKCLVSLAFGGEPIATDTSGGTYFPQERFNTSFNFVTERMPPLTLTGSCNVSLLLPDYSNIDPADPAATLDPRWTISDALLWVEDVDGRRALPPPPPPLLAHAA